MRRSMPWVIVALLLVAAGSAVSMSAQSAPSANPIIGTWKFNAQKSKMSNNLPPRSITRKYDDLGGGVVYFTQELTDAAGARGRSLYVAREDGKDYPLVVASSDQFPAGMISFKRVDAYTTEQTEKTPNGDVTVAGIRKISADGRTMTITSRPRSGGPRIELGVDDIVVFEKQ